MKKMLFVQGGWDGHEPAACVNIVADAIKKYDFQAEISDSLEVYLDADHLKTFDLIVPCWTMGTAPDGAMDNLTAVVRQGVGLAGWHGGMGDSMRDHLGFQFMTGGQFMEHPGGFRDYRVDITAGADPIMDGIDDFTINSEQYYMHVDPASTVLATTTFDGKVEGFEFLKGAVMPVVWKKPFGAGRVFYSSLGHVAREFIDYPQILTFLIRGMRWASR